MRSFATLGFLGAAALAAASDVHDLKTGTFNEFVGSNDIVLAEFFAPWCGHCKALAPEYEEAATELKAKGIALAKVDCTEEQELCKDQGVEGYPTLKVFRGLENPIVYPGQRKAPAIISYMTKQSLPAVSTIDAESLEDFKTQDKVVVVAYFAADDKTSNTTFTSVADSLRDNYLFGATNDAALAEKEGVTPPAVVLYKSFDEGKDTFTEKLDVEAITKFISDSATPLIGEVGPETFQTYMSSGYPLLYIFAEEESERADLAKELKGVAEKYKGKINFATIDAKAFGQHGSNLNLEVGTWPAVAIQDVSKNNEKYPFPQTEKVTAEAIGKFVDEFSEGKIEPSVKSEDIPETQGPVTVVVAKSYKSIVMDDKKDVLIEFYAPWCGHCKALAPKYEELGALYASNSDKIVVGKIDATANDVPDDIQGFPTIKLYKAGDKENPITYSGERSVEGLANFIRDNGTYKIDGLKASTDTAEDPVAKAAEEMPQQAMAATESATESAKEAAETAKGAAIKVVSGAAAAASVVLDVVIDNDGGQADHDEL